MPQASYLGSRWPPAMPCSPLQSHRKHLGETTADKQAPCHPLSLGLSLGHTCQFRSPVNLFAFSTSPRLTAWPWGHGLTVQHYASKQCAAQQRREHSTWLFHTRLIQASLKILCSNDKIAPVSLAALKTTTNCPRLSLTEDFLLCCFPPRCNCPPQANLY